MKAKSQYFFIVSFWGFPLPSYDPEDFLRYTSLGEARKAAIQIRDATETHTRVLLVYRSDEGKPVFKTVATFEYKDENKT